MSETREILEQSIEDHQAAIDKAKRKLEGLETTYSRGDRFKNEDGKYLLVYVKGVTLVNLKTGHWEGNPIHVGNANSITQKKFDEICGSETYTRYWDSQRKELTK